MNVNWIMDNDLETIDWIQAPVSVIVKFRRVQDRTADDSMKKITIKLEESLKTGEGTMIFFVNPNFKTVQKWRMFITTSKAE